MVQESTVGERRLLTVREVARRLGVSERLVWQLRADGQLPCVKLGRASRWDSDTIDEFIIRLGESAA